ncbi:meiosis-specific protein ASY2-like [Brassica napus]|uniref:meiosis-specific protein ASY2-like n=2 Tax=Brassica TaxID=3705 RepID=UPI0020787FA3|nr:meiosis-specific protein ASY2-like [Brassica napus]
MSSSHRLTREQKGKGAVSSRDSGDIHHEAMMDTGNMDLSQRLLVSEAREQFRGDDDGQEAVDASIVPISYYPGNIFAEESPLEVWRIRPSVVDGQNWSNVERTKSTVESVEALLRDLNAHGVSFIVPKRDQRPWSPPKGYQCIYESYFRSDTKLWFPIPRIVTAYAFRRGVALSQLMNGFLRLMVVLSVIAAEAGTSMSVRSFEELTSVSISDDGLVSTRMRPNYNVVTGYPTKTSDWQRSYFYVKSNRSAFEEPPKSGYRVLWNAEMVGHPNLATYPEDWKESARIVALQKQDHWEDFTRERIQRSIDQIASQRWISNLLPLVNQSTSKRLSLFTQAEQKEINRAKTMKQLPDLSLIVAEKIGAKRGASGSRVGPSGLEAVEATPIAAEQTRTGGSSKKSKKKAEDPKESSEPGQTGADGSSKKGGKKRKAGDLPAEDAPKKKKMKKKELAMPRSSSVCEEELQALVPEAIPEVGTSEDDENETIALRRRRRESRVTEEVSRGTLAGDLPSTEVPRGISTLGGQRDRSRNESPAHVTEGSETRVSGRPKETPADEFRFEFNRELPLACYPEDCARLLRLVKGGPDQLPSVGDLIFKDEYEHASCSSVKSHGDWNVLVGKYDTALRRAREQIRESEEAKKKAEEALRVSSREKAEAIAREKSLRKAFDETRTSDAAELQMCKEAMNNLEFVVDKQRKEKADLEAKMAAELLRHSEEMDRLRKSRKYEVTHERVRVLIAMIAKAEKRFHRISLREDKRDKYDDARCLYSQAFGTRKCLEQIKASGVEIPQETIDFFIGQEKHYEEEAERLEVKEIPAEDLCLSPLVLESRFLIEEIWRQLDPFGSNINLIDSEAAIALRTPLRPEDPVEKPAQTAVSSNQPTDQDADLAKQTSAGAVVHKDGAVPTIVLTDSPAKASKNASSSASSSEDPEKGDDDPAGMPIADATAPAPAKFGRISGPGEKDGDGGKNLPAGDE